MSKFIDETGNRYGRLIVLERIFNNHKQVHWKCLCDCGNFTGVRGDVLRRGDTISCNCFRKERVKKAASLPKGVASFNILYARYKRHAKNRNLRWDITKEQFRDITSKNCSYCGKLPMQISGKLRYNGVYIYNGIDRVDNSKGYIEGNTAPCCRRCNQAKSDMSLNEFLDQVKFIL